MCRDRLRPLESTVTSTSVTRLATVKQVEDTAQRTPGLNMSVDAPDFGVAFDIDGVLVRGGQALPRAREVMQSLTERGVPYIFLTNNGGVLEETKAAQIGKLVGVDIDPQTMVLSHTPMRDLVERFGDRRVLVLGPSDVSEVALAYGFTKVVTVDDLVHHYPGQFPFRQYEHSVAPFHDEPIEAVITLKTPIDWGVAVQVAVDVLIGGTPPGGGRSDGSQTPFYVSNDDLLLSSTYPHPRFAQGAFTVCLKTLYKARTDKELAVTAYGKPQPVAYTYAEKLLNRLAGRGASNPLKTIYGIGDNPHSDIQGANNAGAHWQSILVYTGIHDGSREPEHAPDVHADSVYEAIQHIYKQHGLPPM